ncbi:hypothetical protein [Streptomyces mayonensis]|uniref:hypothetical protein n=1 Tax=Streptomyces mayonensis TaxID=2750816 RepID=UPI001C1DE1B7|nr:hypothetical protein [Streptomyces sp. A108]MBU6534250.1 hypothetical protein [Streptomyces sp. A108]
MRRTASALSAAVLASAALGALAGPAAADPGVPPPTDAGEPVAPPSADDPQAVPPPPAGDALAQVSPADVAPGDTVTVSVSCGPTGGAAPATLDATSPAFDGGTVALRKVTGDDATVSGPSYRGTARIAAAGEPEADRSAPDLPDPPDPADPAAPPAPEDPAAPEAPVAPDDLAVPENPEDPGNAGNAAGRSGTADDWTVDGACPDASGGEGDPWSATMTMPEEGGAEPGCRASTAPRTGTSSHGTPCATTKPPCPEPTAGRGEPSAPGKSCGGGTAEHGVQAGNGGSFSDSVPALVAGGLLIAGAFGAAAHRLRLRLRGEDGER